MLLSAPNQSGKSIYLKQVSYLLITSDNGISRLTAFSLGGVDRIFGAHWKVMSDVRPCGILCAKGHLNDFIALFPQVAHV